MRAEAIAADLGSEAERERLAATLGERGLTVEILVNNAGFGDSAIVRRRARTAGGDGAPQL